jgi:hypothetical protein
LRPLDERVKRAETALLCSPSPVLVVDVGLGDDPATTLEMAETLQALQPSLLCIGVDSDPERVERARGRSQPGVEFRQGGFALPLAAWERPALVRAMNVLRSYPEAAVEKAHRQLATALVPGGLLIEGSSDPTGSVTGAYLLRKGPHGLKREALWFRTDFSRGFAPLLFRDWLPRDVRRRVEPGEAIHAFLSSWDAVWRETRARGVRDARAAFVASAQALAHNDLGVEDDPTGWHQGELLWRPLGGVPS